MWLKYSVSQLKRRCETPLTMNTDLKMKGRIVKRSCEGVGVSGNFVGRG
jgi:hypothetical protein